MAFTVIVTGANGFIGSALTEYIRDMGHSVIGWDISEVGNSEGEYRCTDMTHFSDVESALTSVKPDIIFHCAGSANVADSIANPDRDFELNVGITHNLLYAMHRQGLNHTRLVYLSSAAVYGNPKHLPIKENDEVHPISPYALHKSMCEDMCRYFVENHGFDIRIARIFSAYGPGLRKQIFWDMYQKYKNNGKLEMYGDGTESRDFIHIDDLKQALYLIAVSKGHVSSNNMVINVANGEEISIRQTAEIFANCMGISRSAVLFNGIKRVGDPHNWCADTRHLRQVGYSANINIEDGIRQYCDWIMGKK